MFANVRDGHPWTQEDLADLKRSIEAGKSISATAAFLSREGTVGDVVKTAEAHGWYFEELRSNSGDGPKRSDLVWLAFGVSPAVPRSLEMETVVKP